jgi:hypothetical protein
MSPRLTGKELAERRKQRQEEEKLHAEEEKRLLDAQEKEKQERLKVERQKREQHDLLKTFHTELYNEIDKLNRKVPTAPVSDYTLRKVNEHITKVKSFLPDDPYLSEIHPFESAGDNPEYRDVILALAEIGASLKRFGNKLSAEHTSFVQPGEAFDLDVPKDFSVD